MDRVEGGGVPGASVRCDQRVGIARRACRMARRLLELAGRAGSAGVPF